MVAHWMTVIQAANLLQLWTVVSQKNCNLRLRFLHMKWYSFNPFCPKSDQCEFSPRNFSTLSKEKVMKFNKMITSEKTL